VSTTVGREPASSEHASGAANDLEKIVDFCASIVDLGGSPMATERILARADVDLPVSAFVLLRLLDDGARLSVSQLAAVVTLHPSTVSTQLRPLDDDGLIERSVDDGDRRITWISITPAGRSITARVRAIAGEQWQIILGAWSAEHVHQLAELLDRARRDTRDAIRSHLAS
jgi:DNA-binding MarR family transcriptional regulator